MNSVLLNVLELVLWSTIWSFLETVPSALKRMYSAVLSGMFCGYVRSGRFLAFQVFCFRAELLPNDSVHY